MKKVTLIIAIIAAFALIALPAFAGSLSLYEQEEGANDQDLVEVDAADANLSSDASWTNWKYQYGTASWSAVYGSAGWVTASEIEIGDSVIEVEADVELYFTETISNNKIYFHLGNIYTAEPADMIAYVDGSFSSNNGMYIGISFEGSGKAETDFAKDISGNFTGVITDGMQSNHDAWRSQNNQMDVEILLNWGPGWMPPVTYGDGAHSTIPDTLWWEVAGGAAGSYNYRWRIRLMPEPHQPDGDYYLDPVVVAAPVL